MARLPRLTIAGAAHHVIQRGNNRQNVFVTDEDFEYFLGLLLDYARQFQVAVHAYVLMDNHFHLLVTPQNAEGLPQMMQALGRRYVRYFNDRHHRSGTLWEGRYRATVIESERYLLTCMAYLDLNPVRAGMVPDARDYRWSSHAHYAGLRTDRLITPHALYWEMGNTPFAREHAYAEMVGSGVGLAQQTEITDATLKGWALGGPDFLQAAQKHTGRRVRPALAGRPAKRNTTESPPS